MLYAFFWVIPRRQNFYMPTFRNTLFHLHRRCPAYTAFEDATECSETSAHKTQTPGNYQEESIQNHFTLHGGFLYIKCFGETNWSVRDERDTNISAGKGRDVNCFRRTATSRRHTHTHKHTHTHTHRTV